MARSRGVVTKPRTRSASAPTYTVRTVMVALSIFGYWRTLTPRMAWSPAMRITRLTTIARTGRRMNTSVILKSSTSPVRGVWLELRMERDLVVDDHATAVAELEGARDDDLLPRLDALGDRDEIAPHRSEADELLTSDPRRLPVGPDLGAPLRVLRVLDDEHGVTVRGSNDGGRRNGDDGILRRQDDRDVDEHSRPHPVALARYGRTELRVARRRIHVGLDREHAPLDFLSGGARVSGAEGHPDGHAHADPGEVLLRNREVDVRRVRRFEVGDGRARGQVLSDVDESNAQAASEGRAHELAPDLGGERVDVRLVRRELRVVRVALRASDGHRREQGVRATRVRPREIQARARRSELGPLDARVELDQDLSRAHDSARVEVDPPHDPRRIVANRHTSPRRDAADRLQRLLPGLLGGNVRADHLGRRSRLLGLLPEGDQARDLERLHAPQDEDDQRQREHHREVAPASPETGRRRSRARRPFGMHARRRHRARLMRRASRDPDRLSRPLPRLPRRRARHPAREGENRLQVLVGEAKLEAEKVIALLRQEQVVHPAEEPETFDEFVLDVHAVAWLHLLAEPEEVIHDLEAVLQEVDVEADSAGGLLDPEATRERSHPLRELQRKAEGVARRRRDGPVVGGLVDVRCVDARVGDRGEAARVGDELDLVVLVLPRLEPERDVALDGVREKVVVAPQTHDRLQSRQVLHVVVDALGHPLHLVDELVVFRQLADRPLSPVDAAADAVDVLQGALEALARPVDVLERVAQISLLTLRPLRGEHLAHLARHHAHVLEDLGELRVGVLRNLVDVAERVADHLSVLLHRLVQGVCRVGEVLQDQADVLAALLGANRAGELLRDGLDAVGDVLDLVEQLRGRRLVDDDVNLVSVVQPEVIRSPRRQNDDRLAEERRRLLPERRVVVEGDVSMKLHVEASVAVLEPDRVERADGDAGDGDARTRREARRVVDVRVDGVPGAPAHLGADVMVDSVGGGPRQRNEEPNLGRLRASRHLLDKATLSEV